LRFTHSTWTTFWGTPQPLKFSHSTWTTFWGTPQNGLHQLTNCYKDWGQAKLLNRLLDMYTRCQCSHSEHRGFSLISQEFGSQQRRSVLANRGLVGESRLTATFRKRTSINALRPQNNKTPRYESAQAFQAILMMFTLSHHSSYRSPCGLPMPSSPGKLVSTVPGDVQIIIYVHNNG
jgi:hypothetical protein